MYKKLMELIRENPEFDETSGEFYIIDSNSEYGDAMIDAIKEEFGVEDVVRRFVYSFVQDKNILVRLIQEYGDDDC